MILFVDFFLPLILSLIAIFSFVYGIVSYRLTTDPTGKTRLVKNGLEYEIEAECTWFFRLFRCWRKLSKSKPAIAPPNIPYSDIQPKPLDVSSGWISYRTMKFDTREEAEETALSWRAENISEKKIHKNDGPKEKLTSAK